MDSRQQNLQNWLQTQCRLSSFQLLPLAGDASFRRYFRVKTHNECYIAMDAPPALENNCKQFVAIGKDLRSYGLKTPTVFFSDFEKGFLLLEDFGDDLFLQVVKTTNAEALYSQALNELAVLKDCEIKNCTIPFFTTQLMFQELMLSKEWFLQKHLSLTISNEQDKMLIDFFYFLAESAAEQPRVLMHRDYHSANLLLLPSNHIGIIDFQDAFYGPITYDLVSLLRDCYIDWPDVMIKNLVKQYKDQSSKMNVSDDQFIRWFDLMGLQRHLKALLTFSRKLHRDNNSNYLKHIPRTLAYLERVAPIYKECEAFNKFLQNEILPAMKKVSTCAQ